MPYVAKDIRDALEGGKSPASPGELNFCFTKVYLGVYHKRDFTGLESKLWRLVWDYLDQQELRYALINEVIGAISCSIMEFFYRVCPTVSEEDEETQGFLFELDERVTEWKVAVYNKIAVPYEKTKREENGDVYSF